MKSVARIELVPGMILGEDIVLQGEVLYPKDTVLNPTILERLKRYSIMCASIKEDVDFAKTHKEKLHFNEDFLNFEKKHAENLQRYKKLMLDFLNNGTPIPEDELFAIYDDMESTYTYSSELLDFLYNLTPNEEELTYNHCLNSALLAGVFGTWVRMPEEERRTLILCGFYYDIGKFKLPYEVLWKPDKLTDEEYALVKKHPVIGYAMVRNLPIDEHIKNAVIMHHERMDGTGYPYHMKTTKIDSYARYIAMIDTYIAMASPRSYRSAFTPLQILGNFEGSLFKYDMELLIPLMKHIGDAQIGSTVELNDGSVWEVFIINTTTYARPRLKNDKTEFLNLADHMELKIVKNL